MRKDLGNLLVHLVQDRDQAQGKSLPAWELSAAVLCLSSDQWTLDSFLVGML